MKIKKILDGITFPGAFKDIDIKSITYDSRKVSIDTLFVAIKGNRVDGHDYIYDAINRGASAIIANGRSPQKCSIPLIRVKNTRKIMSKLADNFYDHPSSKLNTIGITGTNGKTTTCYLINRIFNEAGLNTGSIGTLGFISSSSIVNTGFTTPESIELHNLLNNLIKGGINNVIMEISSHSLALHRVDDVLVDTAIYTNLSPEHLDFHGNMESYFLEKLKLFSSLGSDNNSIINLDDEYAKRIINNTTSKIMTYGFTKQADIHPISFNFNYNTMSVDLSIMGRSYKIKSRLIGKHNLYNIMASIGSSIISNIPIRSIIKSIEKIKSVPGRMEHVGDDNHNIFIDYAHTPGAFENILSMVCKIKDRDQKIIVLFGCGGDRDKYKRKKMSMISEKYSDIIIVTSDNPRNEPIKNILNDMLQGFSLNKHIIIEDRKEAIKYAVKTLDDKSILLILGKGREDYQIIRGKKYKQNDIEVVRDCLNES